MLDPRDRQPSNYTVNAIYRVCVGQISTYFILYALADSGGGAQGARAPPFEIPKRVFKWDPPKTFAPAALAVAAAPPLSTNPGSAPSMYILNM